VPLIFNTGLIIQVSGLKYVCNFRTTSFCLQVDRLLLYNRYYRSEEAMDHKMKAKFHTHGGDEKSVENIRR
jgi:hypothetical protein